MNIINISSHSYRVGQLVKALLVKAGFKENEANEIGACAAFHDVGKAFIPQSILQKPGRLTQEEFIEVKKHPEKGADFLEKALPSHPIAAVLAREHHERADGRGYPAGLTDKEVPFEAGVCGIADAFEALCAKRCYKDPLAPETAWTMILSGDCGVFSEEVVHLVDDETKKTMSDIVNGVKTDTALDACISAIQSELVSSEFSAAAI